MKTSHKYQLHLPSHKLNLMLIAAQSLQPRSCEKYHGINGSICTFHGACIKACYLNQFDWEPSTPDRTRNDKVAHSGKTDFPRKDFTPADTASRITAPKDGNVTESYRYRCFLFSQGFHRQVMLCGNCWQCFLIMKFIYLIILT